MTQKRTGKTIALILGVALVGAFVWSQRPHVPAAAARSGVEPVSVDVGAARERRIPIVTDAIGTLRSRDQVTIASQLTARVLEVRVSPGDTVASGDVLIVLAGEELEANVARAAASLVVADEALADAERELERTRELFEREARTRQELDRRVAGEAQARAGRDAAAQALAAARASASHARITAPFDAVVGERFVDPGALATSGARLLALFDPDALRLEAVLAEALAGRLSVGDSVPITLDALADAAGAPLETVGRVEELVPAIDPSTRTFVAKLALPKIDGALPGMFGRARVATGERTGLVVPGAALVVRGQLEQVFGVSADGSRAELHLVRSGRRLADGEVELVSGTAGLERVVTRGAERLRDGMPIRIENDSAARGR